MDRRPRRREDCEEIAAPHGVGGGVMFILHPDERRYLEFDATEAALWRLLDGSRTVRELVRETLAYDVPLGPERVGQALLRFARSGLLAGNWGPSAPVRRGRTLGRIEAQPELDMAFQVFVGFFLIFVPLCGLPFLAMELAAKGFHLLPAGGSPWGALLAAWAAVVWRHVVLGCALHGSRLDIPSWGLSWGRGIPSLFFDSSGLLLANRAVRVRVSVAGLYSHLALASIAAIALQLNPAPLPEPFLLQLCAVSLLALFVNLSPVVEGDAARIGEILARQSGLRVRAFTFLSRRIGRQGRDGGDGPPGRAPVAYALAGMLWAVAALVVGGQLYTEMASGSVGLLLTQGPAPTRVALALMLALILAGTFQALALLVWVPLSWLFRPVARRLFATLVTPFAAALALGLVVFSSAASSRLICGLAGFIAVFPLLRARKTFAGSPVAGAVFWLALFAAIRSLAWGAAAAGSAGYLPGGDTWDTALGLTARGASVFLLLTAWELSKLGRLVPRTRMENALAAGIATALVLIAGMGLSRRPGPPGWLEALDLVSGIGVALASIPPILAHAKSPSRQFWRPFGLSLLALAAAGAFGFSCESYPWPAAEGLRWEVAAWPLAIAAAIAARVWLDRGWRRPVRFSRPPVHRGSEREMLVGAAGVFTGSMVDLFAMGVGERQTDSLVRSFNRSAERELERQAMLAARELDIAGWEERDADWLSSLLERSFALLDRTMAERSGRRFTEWVKQTAMDDLYWFEQELLRHYVPKAFPAAPGETCAADRLQEISKVPFFAVLPENEFGALMRLVRLERFHAGHRVVRQGEPANRFFIVSRGELSVLRDDEWGHETPLGHLVAGDCFGESAFVHGGRRSASVVAADDVELYAMERRDLETQLPGYEKISGALESLVRYGGFLRTISFLSVLPQSEVGKLAACLTLEQHPANKTLVRPGDAVDSLYLVLDGRLAVYGPGQKGSRVRLGTLSTGQSFGDRALLGDSPPGTSLVAETRSHVLQLAREHFETVLAEYLTSYSTLEELATPRAELR